uniref:Uncharacterized protein n=1 Tax=Anguilla anguilla TaxID=7936 RepID=A0A0E9RL33_ANGAN
MYCLIQFNTASHIVGHKNYIHFSSCHNPFKFEGK